MGKHTDANLYKYSNKMYQSLFFFGVWGDWGIS